MTAALTALYSIPGTNSSNCYNIFLTATWLCLVELHVYKEITSNHQKDPYGPIIPQVAR